MSQVQMRIRGPLLLCLCVSGDTAFAATAMQTDAGQRVHWTSDQITVAVDAQSASQHLPAGGVVQAIEEAMAVWNGLPQMKVKFVMGSPNKPAAVQVRFCRGTWRRQAGLLGHTEFEAERATGLIDAATIEVNECDHRFVGPDDVAVDHLDLQAVLTHELGHVLGLGHSEDAAAVMFTSTGTVRQRRPNRDDQVGLSMIYDGVTAAPGGTRAGTAGTRPVELRPAKMSFEDSPPAMYRGGKDEPLPFELPWPLTTGNQNVRFVPTLLPMPPNSTRRPPPPHVEEASPPRLDGNPKRREEGKVSRRILGDAPTAPKATELPWPEPATSFGTQGTARGANASPTRPLP